MLTAEDIERFEATRKATRGFRPITLKLRVSEEEMARFAVDRWRFPGVELEPYLTRRYPYGDLFAHIVGYVSRIDDKDLETLGEGNAALTHIGKTGLERYYEEALRGKIGYEQVETNVEGRALRTVGRVPAQSGADLRLSVDANLQLAMVRAFGELEGSAVALDPRTGEVLAMVSLPSYDPNLFVNGISHADFNALNSNPSRPQFNRLVLGGVAPGSTIKPLTALAGLDSGLRKPEDKTLSTGMFRLPGMKGRGWGDSHRGGHGWTDARKSIADSVNTYYYRLALDMGVERYDTYLKKYGFGAPTGIDLMGEIDGILPTPAAKLKLNKERWYPGDLVNAAIGQGMWKVTPLQLARGTAALADHGMLRRLHLVTAQRSGFDSPWQPLQQPAPIRITDHPENLRVVQEGMEMTVNGPGGTARVDQRRRALPHGRQDRYRAGGQPQRRRGQSEIAADAPAPPRAVHRLRARPKTPPSPWQWRSKAAAMAPPPPLRSRARSSMRGCWARCRKCRKCRKRVGKAGRWRFEPLSRRERGWGEGTG